MSKRADHQRRRTEESRGPSRFDTPLPKRWPLVVAIVVCVVVGSVLLAWRRRVGFIFQDHNLLLGWTAEENTTAALMGMGLPRAEQRERARQALERVGLGSRLDHLPGELSMGERRRVAVARALVRQPAFILADEPTADVDETSARLIMEQLLEAARRPDVTLIVATHGDVRPELTARVFVMKSGALIPEGSVS